MFQEIENKNLSISKIEMTADKPLVDNKNRSVPYPLVNKSGFLYQISGFRGSGKSNLLINLINKKAKKGVRQSYRKIFDDIIYVSPSKNTIKNNPLADLDESKKYDEFNEEVLDKLEEILDDNKEEEEPKHTLLILDDVAVALKDPSLQRRFINFSNNRRHLGLNIIIITQVFNQLSPQIRKNLNLLFLFRPKTKQEQESLIKDYFMMDKEKVLDLFDFVYKDRFDFMIIDFTLRQNPNIEYFRNYNKVIINE